MPIRLLTPFICPIEIDELTDPVGPVPGSCGRRASLKGFLAIPLLKYLELLDWTGRQLRQGKRGLIPQDARPILEQLGIQADRWLELASQFGKLFKRAAGSRIALAEEASHMNQNWLQAPGADCFGK